jgi:uncharacterized Zn-finger protein
MSEKKTNYTVSCQGIQNEQDPSLGHPKVYLQINKKEGKVKCPYCGHLFTDKEGLENSPIS